MEAALRKGASEISRRQLLLDDVRKVREIPEDQWEAYVASVWPEFADQLPDRSEVSEGIRAGFVFFGPFVTYGASSGSQG
jgi:hypothetical protein